MIRKLLQIRLRLNAPKNLTYLFSKKDGKDKKLIQIARFSFTEKSFTIFIIFKILILST